MFTFKDFLIYLHKNNKIKLVMEKYVATARKKIKKIKKINK